MRKAMIVAAVMLALAAGACSNDDTPEASDDPVPTTSTAASAAPSASAAADCTDLTGEAAGAPIDLKDFEFSPKCAKVTTNQGFSLHNVGSAEHNFSVEGVAAIDLDIEPGDTNNTENPGLSAGTYTFFCEYHRSSNGMEGQLQVVAA